MQQEQLIANCKEEIAWIGLVDDNYASNIIVVDEIIVPKQEVSSTSVDFDMEFLHEVMEKRPEDAHRMRYFGHSHANMSVYVSNVDWGDFIVMMEQTEVPFIVCHIENHKGESLTQIEVFELGGEKIRLSVEADLKTIVPDELITWAEQQIKENVTKRSYTVSKTYGTYNGVNSSSRGKNLSGGNKKDNTEIELGSGKVINIVYNRKDVKDKGTYILYTPTHRTEFKDGKQVKSQTREEWKEFLAKEKVGGPKKASSNNDLKDQASKNQTPEVKSHKSDSKRKRSEKQESKLDELALLLKNEKDSLLVQDDGYLLTIAEQEDLQKIIDDEYDIDNDEALEYWTGMGIVGGRIL